MNDFPSFTDDLKTELKWLEENKKEGEKISGLKQQKFLLFYNLFLLANEKDANFEGLCAWDNGPVYEQVHAAVKYHYTIGEIISSIKKPILIEDSLAKIAKFIVEVLTDEEVSELTHKFDFWQNIIVKEEKQISIDDISNKDKQKIFNIIESYDLDFILNHKVYKTDNCIFFIEDKDYEFVVNNLKNELEEIENTKPIKIVLNSKEIKEKKDMHKISI